VRNRLREAAIAWIVANQLGRRNLTPSQKAALALEIEKQLAAEAKKRQRMGKQKIAYPSDKGQAREKAAEMVSANPHYVTDAKKIAQDAPEILDQVKHGTLSIPQAKRVAALPAAEWARRKNMGIAAIQHCRSYALDAERKMGEMLRETERQKPGQYQQRLHEVTVAPTLADLGVTKRESVQASSPGASTRCRAGGRSLLDVKRGVSSLLATLPIPTKSLLLFVLRNSQQIRRSHRKSSTPTTAQRCVYPVRLSYPCRYLRRCQNLTLI
jgi:hypothetical protein